MKTFNGVARIFVWGGGHPADATRYFFRYLRKPTRGLREHTWRIYWHTRTEHFSTNRGPPRKVSEWCWWMWLSYWNPGRFDQFWTQNARKTVQFSHCYYSFSIVYNFWLKRHWGAGDVPWAHLDKLPRTQITSWQFRNGRTNQTLLATGLTFMHDHTWYLLQITPLLSFTSWLSHI